MPTAQVNGVEIAYQESGEGFPLVWCHEFAGSMESWEPQVHYFSRRYRVITYNARGYPPSEVPKDVSAYSQDLAVEDLYGLLKHLGIEQTHVGGLSMGGSTTLHFGIRHPEMARSLIIAAAGSGSTNSDEFRATSRALADRRQAIRCLQEQRRGDGRGNRHHDGDGKHARIDHAFAQPNRCDNQRNLTPPHHTRATETRISECPETSKRGLGFRGPAQSQSVFPRR